MKDITKGLLIIVVVFFMISIVGNPSTFDNHSFTGNPLLQVDNSKIAYGESWLSGWQYRQRLGVYNVAGSGTYYQIKLVVNYDATVAYQVDCDAHCQTDFDDIRVTDSGGSTELDYWMETYTASTSATFWIEVTADLGGEVVDYIYIYYGNAGVSTTSNGDNTFIFFDDFEDGTLDKWPTQVTASIVTDRVYSGTYSCYLGSGAAITVGGLGNITTGIAINSAFNSENSLRGVYHYVGSNYPISEYTMYSNQREAGTSKIYYLGNAVYAAWPSSTDIYDDDTWYPQIYAMDQNQTDPDMRLWVNGNYQGEIDQHEGDGTDWETQSVESISFQTQASYPGWVDEVFVRKFNFVGEPFVSTFAAEEDSTPINDATPVCTNLDDTDNLYARYKLYEFSVSVTSLAGASSIDYVELSCMNGASPVWTVRFDEDTATYSEQTGPTYIELTGSTNVTSGVNLDITFKLYIEWVHPDATDYDLKQYVVDGAGLSDTDTYSAIDYDYETRLVLTTPDAFLNDGLGNTGVYAAAYQTGPYNTEDVCTASGTWIYSGSSDNYPPANEIDVYVNCSATPVTNWEAINYNGGTGAWSVLVDSDDIVGLDTYYAVPVEEGTGANGIPLWAGNEFDSYECTQLEYLWTMIVADDRVNVGDNVACKVSVYYDGLGVAVSAGSMTVNGFTATYNGTPGWWGFTATYGSVGLVDFETVILSNDIIGFAGLSGKFTDTGDDSRTIIWDRIQVQSYICNDTRASINQYSNTTVLLYYDYDNAALTDGTVTINGVAATHIANGYWYIQTTSAAVTAVTYNNVQCTGNTYGITAEDQNGQSQTVIWDRIQVSSYTVIDARVDINDYISVNVTLIYDYDNTDLINGTVTINGETFTYNTTGGIWSWTGTSVVVAGLTFDTIVVAGNTPFGITATDDNSKSQTIIWDQIIIRGYVSNSTDNWDNINTLVNISLWIQYDYDDTNVTDGTIFVNGDEFLYLAGWNWTALFSNATASRALWDTVVAAGNTYDLTNVNQNSKSIEYVWDSMIVYVSVPDDQRIDIGTNCTGLVIWAVLDYNSTVFDGTLQLNDTTYDHDVVGIYYYYVDTVTNGGTYDITAISATGNNTYCIFDALIAWITPVIDQRINIGANASGMILWANYSYDSAAYDGGLELNDTTYDHNTVGIWYYNVTIADGFDTYGITVITNGGNQTYCIFDQIKILGYNTNSSDDRDNIGTYVNISVWIQYDYDDTNVTDGTIIINGDSYAYNADSGNWTAIFMNVTVSGVTWDTVVASVNTYAITAVNQNSKSQTIVWDEIEVYYCACSDAENRTSSGAAVGLYFKLQSKYDGHEVDAGETVEVNGIGYAWDGTYWSALTGAAGPILKNYAVTSVISYYGITALDAASVAACDIDVIYDKVLWQSIYSVNVTGVSPYRINVSQYVNITILVYYEYDDTNVVDGTITMNGESMTHIANGYWYIIVQNASAAFGQDYTFNTIAADGNAYDIEVENQNSKTLTIIWDEIYVWEDGCVYTDTFARVNIHQNVTLWANAWLVYDKHNLTSGDYIEFGDERMVWSVANSRFEHSYVEHSVGLFTYTINTTLCYEATYGITVGTNSPVNLIFDRILIETMWLNDTYANPGDPIEVWVWLTSEYDGENMTVGLVQLNGTLGTEIAGDYNFTHVAVGNWSRVETLGAFGSYVFEITWANWTTYNLTEINYNGWNVTYLGGYADRIIVMGYVSNSTDNRDNIGTYVNISVWLQYESDSTNVTDGTIFINGDQFLFLVGWNWTALFMNATGSGAEWNTTVASGNTRGITEVNQNGKSISYIWDSYTVIITIGDNRVDVEENATIGFTVLSDYDALAYDGTTILNDTTYDHTSVGIYYYTLVALTGDDTYGITSMTNDADYVIWDNIIILTTITDDARIDIATAAIISVTAQLEYDGHSLGAGDTLYMNNTAMSWNGSHFVLSPTFSVVGKYQFYVNSTGANEATYGITLLYSWVYDDILYYPDVFSYYNILYTANAGVAFVQLNNLINSYSIDGIDFGATDYVFPYESDYLYLDFYPNETLEFSSFTVHLYGSRYAGELVDIMIYNWTSSTYEQLTASGLGTVDAWTNITFAFGRESDYFHLTNGIRVRWESQGDVGTATTVGTKIDYCGISYNNTITSLINEILYGESFANVTDWILNGTASFVTDGDVGTFTSGGDNNNFTECMFAEVSVNNYFEIRTIAGSAANYSIWLYNGSNWLEFISYGDVGFGTYKTYISSDSDFVSGSVSGIRIYTSINTMTVLIDYIRIGLITQLGWQHDCSIIDGITTALGGSITTDGDYLSMIADADGSTFEFDLGTYVNTTYYPYLTISFHEDDYLDSFLLAIDYGSGYVTLQGTIRIGYNIWRWDVSSYENITALRFTIDNSQTVRLDWLELSYLGIVNTTSVIWDSLTITITGPTDNRQNINANATGIVVSAVYDYDSITYDGTLDLNNTDYDGDGTVTIWYYEVDHANGDDTYDITVISTNDNTYMIWDQIIVIVYETNSTDDRDTIGTYVNVTVSLQYDYDDTNLVDGTVFINGQEFDYLSGSFWNATFVNATVSNATWNVVVVAGNVYNITSVNQNGQSYSYIWDQIIVLGYNTDSTDDRDDIGTYVNVSVWLQYDYDDSNVTDGFVWVNGQALLYLAGWNWTALFMNATVSDATWDTITTSANVWGITSVNQNGQSYSYIWDRINVTVTVNMTWTVIGYYITVSYDGEYDYDDDTSWNQNATIANTTMTIDFGGLTESLTKTTVENYTFYATLIEDTNFSLSAFITNTVWCVWDNVTGSVIISPGAEIGGNIPYTIFVYNLAWEYNGSAIDIGWVFEHIDNDTLVVTVDSDGSGFLIPPMWIIVQPSTEDAWVYSNNATATIDGVLYDFTWYTSSPIIIAADMNVVIESAIKLEDTMVVSGTTNMNFDWTIYEENLPLAGETGTFTVIGDVDGWVLEWDLTKTVGQHNYSILFNTTSSGYRWFNSSYYFGFDINIDPPEVKDVNVEVRGTTNIAATWWLYAEGSYDSQTGAVAPDTFSFFFTKKPTSGLHNYSIKFNVTTGQYIWKNGSYYVSGLVVSDTLYTFGTSYNYLSGTISLNCNYTIYENGTIVGPVAITAGSFAISWARNTAVGYYQWAVNFSDSLSTRWVNGSYQILPDITGVLAITGLSYSTSGVNFTFYWNTNWANTTGQLFYNNVNQSIVIAERTTLSYEKPTVVGDYNISIRVFGGGANILWVNYTYSVEDLGALYLVLFEIDVSNPENVTAMAISSWANATIYIYENGVLKDTDTEGSLLLYAKATIVGNYSIALLVDGGASTLWVNTSSYEIPIVYDWSYISLYGPDAIGLDPLLFKIYVNDTRVWSLSPSFYNRTDYVYNITILNFLNETISANNYTWARFIDVSLNVYTLFVYSQLEEEFIYFNITSTAGATWRGYVPPRGNINIAIYASTNYTYAFTVLQGGKGGTFGGVVNIDADFGIIINAYNLMDIFRGIQNIGTGGLTEGDIKSALLSVYGGPMGQIQFFSWLSAILLFIGLYAVPFVRSRSKKEGGGEIDVAQIMSTGGYTTTKKKGETPAQLKPFEFPKGPLNPKYKGLGAGMDDMSDFVWGRLKGTKKKGKK